MKNKSFLFGVPFVVCVFIIGFTGGAASHYYFPNEHEIKYEDLISLVLTGIAIILTVLGTVIAIFAISGWYGITDYVKKIVVTYLEDNLNDDKEVSEPIAKLVKSAFIDYLKDGIYNEDEDPHILIKQIVQKYIYDEKI